MKATEFLNTFPGQDLPTRAMLLEWGIEREGRGLSDLRLTEADIGMVISVGEERFELCAEE